MNQNTQTPAELTIHETPFRNLTGKSLETFMKEIQSSKGQVSFLGQAICVVAVSFEEPRRHVCETVNGSLAISPYSKTPDAKPEYQMSLRFWVPVSNPKADSKRITQLLDTLQRQHKRSRDYLGKSYRHAGPCVTSERERETSDLADEKFDAALAELRTMLTQ